MCVVGTAEADGVAGMSVVAGGSTATVVTGVETVVDGGIVVTTVVAVVAGVLVVAAGVEVVGFVTYPLFPMSGL